MSAESQADHQIVETQRCTSENTRSDARTCERVTHERQNCQGLGGWRAPRSQAFHRVVA